MAIINVGVFARVPDRFQPLFPPVEGNNNAPAHITLLYVAIKEERIHQFVTLVESVCASIQPFSIHAEDYGLFQTTDGGSIPHVIPRLVAPRNGRGLVSFEQLNGVLHQATIPLHVEQASHTESAFKPHITLQYLEEGEEYKGPLPSAFWFCDHLEIWVRGGDKYTVSLGTMHSAKVNESTARYGSRDFEIGHNRANKIVKNFRQALANKRNAKKGKKKRLEKAKEFHQSPEGQKLHNELARYNQGNHNGDSLVKVNEASIRTTDDVVTDVVRKLLRLQAIDVILDVDTDDADVYVYFMPNISRDEMEQIYAALRRVNQYAMIVGTPEGATDSPLPTLDTWVAFLPYEVGDNELVPVAKKPAYVSSTTKAPETTPTTSGNPFNDVLDKRLLDISWLSESRQVFVVDKKDHKVEHVGELPRNPQQANSLVEAKLASRRAVFILSGNTREAALTQVKGATHVGRNLHIG